MQFGRAGKPGGAAEVHSGSYVIMRGALGGGATRTLRLDQTGKAMGNGLLRLPIIAEA